MIKAPIDLQDLRRRLYVKAKAEPSERFTAPRLRLAAVASPMAISAVADSGANMISLINLEMKCAGTRSAGNPHAACDVAGAGNGITNIPSRARRGQPRIQTRDVLSGYRASSRPYHAADTDNGSRHEIRISEKRFTIFSPQDKESCLLNCCRTQANGYTFFSSLVSLIE